MAGGCVSAIEAFSPTWCFSSLINVNLLEPISDVPNPGHPNIVSFSKHGHSIIQELDEEILLRFPSEKSSTDCSLGKEMVVFSVTTIISSIPSQLVNFRCISSESVLAAEQDKRYFKLSQFETDRSCKRGNATCKIIWKQKI